jgi:two-component system response regulator YesN
VTAYLLKPVNHVELMLVIQKLTQKLKGSAAGKEERPIIRRIKKMIALRLEQDISLQYLADQVNLNHRYLSVLFKTETGVNLSDYVTQCRIDKAKNLFKQSQLKIQDISRLSGYPNAKYFMSVFKQIVGSTPTEYREHPEAFSPTL